MNARQRTSDIVLLPRQHDLWRTVVSSRNVTSHLRVLDSGKTEIANLQIAVLVDKNVGRLEIAVDDTGRVDVFETTLGGVNMLLKGAVRKDTYEDLVQEVLDELLLQRARGEQTVEICAKELGHKVAVNVSDSLHGCECQARTCPQGER
jgi:hypothetical protein